MVECIRYLVINALSLHVELETIITTTWAALQCIKANSTCNWSTITTTRCIAAITWSTMLRYFDDNSIAGCWLEDLVSYHDDLVSLLGPVATGHLHLQVLRGCAGINMSLLQYSARVLVCINMMHTCVYLP